MEVKPIGQHPMLVDVGPTDAVHADGRGHLEKGVGVRADSISISEEAEKHLVVVGAKGGAEASMGETSGERDSSSTAAGCGLRTRREHPRPDPSESRPRDDFWAC